MGKQRENKIHKINVQLVTEDDLEAYREIKALAARHGMTIQEAIRPGIYHALTLLQKRTLSLNTTLRISKARGVVPVEKEK